MTVTADGPAVAMIVPVGHFVFPPTYPVFKGNQGKAENALNSVRLYCDLKTCSGFTVTPG